MTFSIEQLATPPKIRCLPNLTDEQMEEIAWMCGGLPVDWGAGRGIYTTEQFQPVINELRKVGL